MTAIGTTMRGTMAALTFLTLPAAAAAQQRVSFEGQGGLAVPTGRLADLVDAGPAVGMGLGYHLSPRVTLGVDGNVDMLDGARLSSGARAPDLRMWRYGVGVSADLLPAERWALVSSLGVGATRFSSDRFTVPDMNERVEFRKTYLASNAGLKLGYGVSDRVTTYIGARGVWTDADEDDTAILADLDRQQIRPFGSAWTVPVSIGLSVKTGGGRKVAAAPLAARTSPTRAPASDDRTRREAAARELCEQAEAALQAGDYARARSLYQRAKSTYPGTLCADAADRQLEKVADVETIRERIHFEYDLARITDDAAKVLQRKATVLRKYPDLKVVIEGHCDERGSLEYNQALGLRRAESTKRHLAALGVPERMFEVASYGEERPLVALSGESAWSQNRRSEFVARNLGAM